MAQLDEVMVELLVNRHQLHYPMGRDHKLEHQVMRWIDKVRQKVRAGAHAPSEYINVENILNEMRLIKDKEEIELMRKAASISSEAHCRAMALCKPGMYEFQLASELHYVFSHHGCDSPAYPSIVAGGGNACVLHYVDNKNQLEEGDLVLIDAAGEFQNYAADITRTFPVNGKFTPEQRAIYEIVLKAQLAAMEKIKPGVQWHEMQNAALSAITKGLVELGILSGSVEKLLEEKAYLEFYMHNSGHWLGLDVHDVGEYKINGEWRPLQPGMVLTVEPGIYIAGGNDKVDKKWWDIGVRIEDDVLVTENGHEVLSTGVPKQVEELEKLVGSQVS